MLKSGLLGLAGPADPRLTEGQNRAARGQGLTAAGLHAIARSAPGGTTGAAAIAEGLLGSREATARAQELTLKAEQQQRVRALVGEAGLTPRVLQQLFVEAMASGDVQGARSISEVLKTMGPGPERALQAREVLNPEGERVMATFDPATGQWNYEGAPRMPEDTGFRDARVIQDPSSPTGWSYMGFDRNLGIERVVQGAPPPGGSQSAASGPNQAVSGAILQDLEAAFDPRLSQLDTAFLSRLAESRNPGAILGLVSDLANRGLGDVQPSAAAAARVGGMVQRVMSGAQMSNQERAFYRSAFAIRGGDSPETIAGKRAAVEMVATRIGGATPEAVAQRAEELGRTEEGRAQLRSIFSEASRLVPGAGAPPGAGGGSVDLEGLRRRLSGGN